MTKAEITLWEYLRTKPFGIKFRRQHPIGSYVADFYCHSLKLIIEVDGNIHLANDVKNNDILRQENLESEGLIFLRFTNEQIETNLNFVIETINKYINHTGKPL